MMKAALRTEQKCIGTLAMDTRYYVYIMTDKMNSNLYTGVSRDLKRKMDEQKAGILSRFIKRKMPAKLLYYEIFYDPYYAVSREKKIKSDPMLKKIELIQCMNRQWRDLYDDL
jgi:putative endonuclease